MDSTSPKNNGIPMPAPAEEPISVWMDFQLEMLLALDDDGVAESLLATLGVKDHGMGLPALFSPQIRPRLKTMKEKSPTSYLGILVPGLRALGVNTFDLDRHLQGLVPTTKIPTRTAIPVLITLDTVTRQQVQWLWWPYLALGTLAMLDGDPGIGKSLLTLQLAASLSKGYPLPDQYGAPTLPTGEPSSSLFLALEDSLASTMRPRLEDANADLRRCAVMTGWRGAEDEEYAFTLADMDVLRQALDHVKPRLVVIDPIQSYLGAKVDINRANETRPLLSALARVAEEYQCCVLCIRHAAKSGGAGGKAIMRGLGSIDFIGAARTALFVEESPIDRTVTLLAQTKNNTGPLGRTQRFSKKDGVFQWAGITRMDSEILAGSGRGPDPHAFFEAYCWLEQRLEGGIPVPTADIEMQAEEEMEISKRTLRRAKKALEIRSLKQGEVWMWKLPTLSLLSPPPTTVPGHLDTLGPLGSLGSLGHLEPLQPLTEDGPLGQENLEGQGGQVDQVRYAHDAHDAGARDSKIMPESQASRRSPLMAWDACPQCQQSHWAPDTGAPLVCLACGYVTE